MKRSTEFRKLPEDEQRKQLALAREETLKLRARHIMEYEAAQSGDFDRYATKDQLTPCSHPISFDRYNYWTFHPHR